MVLLAILVIVVSMQVFSRQVLGQPLSWSEEAARYLMVWLCLASAVLLFAERGHIAVHMGVRMLPKKFHVPSQVLVELVVIAWAFIVLLFGGWRASQNAFGQALSALPGTIGMMFLILPISGALVVWFASVHIIRIVRHEIDPLPADISEEVLNDGRS